MTEIIPGLWVGSQEETVAFVHEHPKALVLSVLESQPTAGLDELWIPIRTTNTIVRGVSFRQLDLACTVIHAGLETGQIVAVHCGAGIERSPLTIAYYLTKYKGFTWDEAYQLLREQRPSVADRREWLPEEPR